jgi:hypothetical protein
MTKRPDSLEGVNLALEILKRIARIAHDPAATGRAGGAFPSGGASFMTKTSMVPSVAP